MSEREHCYDCMRPLTTDGVTWSCKPCGRSGYYDTWTSLGQRLRVRMVTHWRPEPAALQPARRRAA